MSTSKVAGQCLARRRIISRQWRRCGYSLNSVELGDFAQIGGVNSIGGINSFSSAHKFGGRSSRFGDYCCNSNYKQDSSCIQQTRKFLGVGDGKESGMLSKAYEERRVLGYSPEQLFAVVAAVDLYEDFLPWCQRSEILRRNPDGSIDAELEIGFKFLVESYVSHVELEKPKYIKTTATQGVLFDHLVNIWEFNPGPAQGTCDLHFLVDFKFQSPLYGQMTNMFFKEVVSRLVSSFNDRCRIIYGPGVQVLESSY